MTDKHMVKFFSWGIFTNSSTCKNFYGREVPAKKDVLLGWTKMVGSHKVMPGEDFKLNGVILELTEKEFQQTEDFENRAGYFSIDVVTASGENCKLYVTTDILNKFQIKYAA